MSTVPMPRISSPCPRMVTSDTAFEPASRITVGWPRRPRSLQLTFQQGLRASDGRGTSDRTGATKPALVRPGPSHQSHSGAGERSAQGAEAIVERWHSAALNYIATKEFTETWLDFATAWTRIKYPAGQEPVAVSFRNALARPLPAAAEQYDELQVRLLVALCRELQHGAGHEPFFLDCRTAGRLLDVPYRTAARWLQLLALDDVLDVVRVGTRGKSSEYRYLGDSTSAEKHN